MPKANLLHAKIATYVRNHPELTLAQMSDLTGISISSLSKIAKKYGVTRGYERFTMTPELMKVLES